MQRTVSHQYIVALGSNMRVPEVGAPSAVLDSAAELFENQGLDILARSRTMASRPIGPSQRLFANAAILIETRHEPLRLLSMLQSIERKYGRRNRGVYWRARPLDLDIVMWSGGTWSSRDLTIPHPLFRERDFVLRPVAQIAPHWRDPLTGLTVRQLAARVF